MTKKILTISTQPGVSHVIGLPSNDGRVSVFTAYGKVDAIYLKIAEDKIVRFNNVANQENLCSFSEQNQNIDIRCFGLKMKCTPGGLFPDSSEFDNQPFDLELVVSFELIIDTFNGVTELQPNQIALMTDSVDINVSKWVSTFELYQVDFSYYDSPPNDKVGE